MVSGLHDDSKVIVYRFKTIATIFMQEQKTQSKNNLNRRKALNLCYGFYNR
jgi:hypothetical protein